MSTAATHPQQLVNSLSLLSNNASGLTHTYTSANEVTGSADAQNFWLRASQHLIWSRPPSVAYGKGAGSERETWFPDGQMNTAWNCLDKHVEAGFGERIAFQHYSPLPAASAAPERTMSYSELLEEVKILAGVLRNRLGVKKGDRVIIYMPMILEGAIAMLACARIGAIHSTVFGGFAPRELAKRIDDAKPAAILAASCGLEPKGVVDYSKFVRQAQEFAEGGKDVPLLMLSRDNIKGHQVPQLSGAKEFDWKKEVEAIKSSGEKVDKCEQLDSSHPLYILYTSGTTGTPKGVVRDNGGHAVASRYTMEHTFGLKRDDTIFCASDYGWVVGHSFCLYSPLLVGCTSIIFEGKPILPDAGVFWKIIEKHRVNCLFTAPTALRAIRREDPEAKLMAKYDLSSLRSLFLAGERSEPGIINHYQGLLKKMAAPGAIVNDNYWSTESGSPITAIQLGTQFSPLAPRPGSAGLPLPGMDVRIVDDEGQPVKAGDMGNIVLAQPLPPSALITVWKNEGRFQEAYFDRFRGKGDYFDTGDAGVIDENGYVSVLSRADDLINVAGHRLGTSLLEQVVSAHPLVAECCVVGLPDELKGHVPFALVTRGSSEEAQNADLSAMLKVVNEHVRTDVGSIATLGGLVCGRLPKTRSGKTLRRTVKELVENASVGKYDAEAKYPPTIEDVSAVDDARKAINEYFQSKKEGKSKL